MNTIKTPKTAKKKKSLQPQADEDDASEEERWLDLNFNLNPDGFNFNLDEFKF